MRREAFHEPTMKERLRAEVEEPGQAGLIVVNDGEERPSSEDLPELEARLAPLAGKQATGHVEELPIGAAAISGPTQLEQRAT